jgi:hypothetical protein
MVPFIADHHQLASLVCCHQERGAEPPQKAGEIGGVDRTERRRRNDLDRSRRSGLPVAIG